MSRLYEKSKIWFAVVWIVAYVIGTSVADELSRSVGVEKSITLPFLIALTGILVFWLCHNGLLAEYGLCKSILPAKRMLYYIPLVLMASCNLWLGVAMNYGFAETVLYICSMLCIGFLEELIFRGFLFNAMRKDNLKAAMIVSSLTFGFGHIVNLFNGSGAQLLSNLCQVCYAISAGFLFVIIFYKTKSLWACIFTHSVLNALSAFSLPQSFEQEITVSMILCVIPAVYSLILLKKERKSFAF